MFRLDFFIILLICYYILKFHKIISSNRKTKDLYEKRDQ